MNQCLKTNNHALGHRMRRLAKSMGWRVRKERPYRWGHRGKYRASGHWLLYLEGRELRLGESESAYNAYLILLRNGIHAVKGTRIVLKEPVSGKCQGRATQGGRARVYSRWHGG